MVLTVCLIMNICHWLCRPSVRNPSCWSFLGGYQRQIVQTSSSSHPRPFFLFRLLDRILLCWVHSPLSRNSSLLFLRTSFTVFGSGRIWNFANKIFVNSLCMQIYLMYDTVCNVVKTQQTYFCPFLGVFLTPIIYLFYLWSSQSRRTRLSFWECIIVRACKIHQPPGLLPFFLLSTSTEAQSSHVHKKLGA